MIVEGYDVNPAANYWSYQVVSLTKNMVVTQGFLASWMAGAVTAWLCILKGTQVAFAAANLEQCVYAYRSQQSYSERLFISLPAGTYTFGAYWETDVVNARWAFHLV